MTISASHPMPSAPTVFQQIMIFKSGSKVIEAEVDVIASDYGDIKPTGKMSFSIPMTTKVKLVVDGDEIPLQIRVPIRARNIVEAWAKYDDELKINYNIGVQNELVRRNLIKTEEPT